MRYNNDIKGFINRRKKFLNQNDFKNNEYYFMNANSQSVPNSIDKKLSPRTSLSISKNSNNSSNNNLQPEFSKKKNMGFTQKNFYTNNNDMNYFPNIYSQRQIAINTNDNFMRYTHQQNQKIYNDLFNSMLQQNFGNDKFEYIFDFEYKRPEEKLKKGQNQLILERLQQKYLAKLKEKNMLRTGTGFFPKKNNKNITKTRQNSAQENIIIESVGGNSNNNNKINDNKDIKKENNNCNDNNYKEKIKNDENKNIKVKKFNKTFANGFNSKKYKKEKRKI